MKQFWKDQIMKFYNWSLVSYMLLIIEWNNFKKCKIMKFYNWSLVSYKMLVMKWNNGGEDQNKSCSDPWQDKLAKKYKIFNKSIQGYPDHFLVLLLFHVVFFLGFVLIQEDDVEYDEGPGDMIQEPPFNSLHVWRGRNWSCHNGVERL